jgi:ATP-binding cassette subfamily C (CFTR/MRP) protein 4
VAAGKVEFETRIANVRNAEIAQIQKAVRLKAWNEAVYYACNVVVSATVFIVHVASGGVLSSRTVFSTITLINAMQIELTKHFSLGIMVRLFCCYILFSSFHNFLRNIL